MTIEPFWSQVTGPELYRGDWLPKCSVPVLNIAAPGGVQAFDSSQEDFDLCVITQSCDLANGKARSVACVPTFSVTDFESANPKFAKKGHWNDVLKGRVEGLYLLASQTNPDDNRQALVVDFRAIYSLPFDYLTDHAARLGLRWRLKSPFLEHFSQAFARFFMRVGLPSTIPEFR